MLDPRFNYWYKNKQMTAVRVFLYFPSLLPRGILDYAWEVLVVAWLSIISMMTNGLRCVLT